jgi:hypothetical protein
METPVEARDGRDVTAYAVQNLRHGFFVVRMRCHEELRWRWIRVKASTVGQQDVSPDHCSAFCRSGAGPIGRYDTKIVRVGG